jgi:cytochrome d ubiquinol oxidase subunit I
MSELDPLLLARIQFAANISFHILFPAITIALGWFLLFFRVQWLRTRQPHWLALNRFWTKVFALAFALGVVSGITMSFQFGTNWPGYMETVGDIAGPLLGYEVLTAFFLEASFLGIMLFGQGRVSERTQVVATALVAFGTTLSAFWILALNSWMHTPQGHALVEGRYIAVDWLAVIFNPSFPYRLSHMLLASGLTAAFLIAGLGAWQLLRGKEQPSSRPGLRCGLWVAALLIPLQLVVGDLHGLNTLKHQPAKIAAMEGLWHSESGAPLVLFGIPDAATSSNRFSVEIPKLASLILTHELQGELRGISDFPGNHPPVAPVFYAFRLMVGLGMLMWLSAWTGLWLTRQGRVPPRLLLRVLALMTFSGWVATLAGWYVTEIGRQPWLVTGILSTADAVSKTPAPMVLTSLILYLLLYAVLLVAFITVLRHMASKPLTALAPMIQPPPVSILPVAGAQP